MRTADYPEVPDDFGHWLAGFIDGEGSFTMAGRAGRPTPRFALSLRDDDLPIQRQIVAITAIGHIDRVKPGPDRIHPKTVWAVNSRQECLRLTDLLTLFPLRAKKARDFVTWRQAVQHWTVMRQGPASRLNDWRPMQRLDEQLRAGRAYDPTEVPPIQGGPPGLWED